jgi:hypothetical protein
VTGFTTPGGMTAWDSAELDSLGPTVRGMGRPSVGLYEGCCSWGRGCSGLELTAGAAGIEESEEVSGSAVVAPGSRLTRSSPAPTDRQSLM